MRGLLYAVQLAVRHSSRLTIFRIHLSFLLYAWVKLRSVHNPFSLFCVVFLRMSPERHLVSVCLHHEVRCIRQRPWPPDCHYRSLRNGFYSFRYG